MSHTPGPWIFETDHWNGSRPADPEMAYNIYSPDAEWNVAEIWGDNGDEVVAQANARLIAAAPDLLEMCRQVDEAFKYLALTEVPGEPLHGPAALVKAVLVKLPKVIAKAEGR